jgi:hypothetical protein
VIRGEAGVLHDAAGIAAFVSILDPREVERSAWLRSMVQAP